MPHPPSLALLRSLRLSLDPPPNHLCCQCASSGSLLHLLSGRWRSKTTSRRAATYRSPTAVTAQKQIPPRFERLYIALQNLKKDALSHVDLGRLQLALRGLESPTPTIRVASEFLARARAYSNGPSAKSKFESVLGLNNFSSVRRLARLLLADPLDPAAQWEKELSLRERNDDRSLLLRFGEDTDPVSSSSILATQHVPSRILKTLNIELLLLQTSISRSVPNSKEDLENIALVPLIGTPTSSAGSVSPIRHPVHCSMLLADGPYGCVELGRAGLSSQAYPNWSDAVIGLLNLADIEGFEPHTHFRDIAMIDIEKANDSLDLFRKSKENTPEFVKAWRQSSLANIITWLSTVAETQKDGMRLAIRKLIQDVIYKTSVNVSESRYKFQEVSGVKSTDQHLEPLRVAVREWSTQSHEELRDGLNEGISGKDWAKITWWKLLWRVDDVGMVLSQVMEQHWLTRADRGLWRLEGRCDEARLGVRSERVPKHLYAEVNARKVATLITDTRRRLSLDSIPRLESLAQHIVVQTLSLTTLSSAFATLIFLDWATVTAFEAGAFAALGVTLSLRRLQSRWESAKQAWIEELHEEGRKALRDAEDDIKARMARGPRARLEDEQLLEDLDEAQAAVDEALNAFNELNGLPES